MRQKYSVEQVKESFWNKVEFTTDCWEWKGGHNAQGYGRFWSNPKSIQAHRFAYESQLGKIPLGLPLDHLCKNVNCVNPSHLEPVTDRENVLRSDGIASINAKKTHCHRGHELSGSNLYVHNNQRKCKTCRRINWRNRKNAQ